MTKKIRPKSVPISRMKIIDVVGELLTITNCQRTNSVQVVANPRPSKTRKVSFIRPIAIAIFVLFKSQQNRFVTGL